MKHPADILDRLCAIIGVNPDLVADISIRSAPGQMYRVDVTLLMHRRDFMAVIEVAETIEH
jgi:hypothetical protein